MGKIFNKVSKIGRNQSNGIKNSKVIILETSSFIIKVWFLLIIFSQPVHKKMICFPDFCILGMGNLIVVCWQWALLIWLLRTDNLSVGQEHVLPSAPENPPLRNNLFPCYLREWFQWCTELWASCRAYMQPARHCCHAVSLSRWMAGARDCCCFSCYYCACRTQAEGKNVIYLCFKLAGCLLFRQWKLKINHFSC